MITIGSVSRDEAASKFEFLSKKYRGRRKALKEFTHTAPDYVFWVHPDGKLFDAKDSHKKNYPRGFEHILDDEPDYGGFLRGRVASNYGPQLIVVYCRTEALAEKGEKLDQFLKGVSQLPIPLSKEVIVVSDNADLYGTLDDLQTRQNEN
jgi:hypothetical protein